jgi:hypothetical protein
VITNTIVGIDSTFDRGPFTGVRQTSKSIWIFSIPGNRAPWTNFRQPIYPNSCPVGITYSPKRSRELYQMCVLYSGFSPCVGFYRKISVRSCRKSVFPGTQRSRQFGIRNSSSDFSVRSIAVRRKGNEITPFSYWPASWGCGLGIFAL